MWKSSGPKIEPYGTPARISGQSESGPLMSIIKKLQKRFRRFPDIPSDLTLYSNPLCHTLSNTFEISKKLPLNASDGL